MNVAAFISKRLAQVSSEGFSKAAVRMSIVSMSLAILIMLLAVFTLLGFQRQISAKITGFAAHIQIESYDNNSSLQSTPIKMSDTLIEVLYGIPGIAHLQKTAIKAGILKTDEEIQGVVLKGIGADYDTMFISGHLLAGKVGALQAAGSRSALISARMAARMKLSLGADIRIWFVSGQNLTPRGRKFTISGIYETGLEDFDDNMIIINLDVIRQLNNWAADEFAYLEVLTDHVQHIPELDAQIYKLLPYDLVSYTAQEAYPHIYDWLELQDMNVVIILFLMLLVGAITLVSTFLILVLERTQMIGLLKALGSQPKTLNQIFIMLMIRVLLKSLLIGNVLAISLSLLQQHTQILKLDQASYFIDHVPLSFDTAAWIMVNLGTAGICLMVLLIPAYIIRAIQPAQALRYE